MSAMARPLLLWSVAGVLGGIGTGLLFDAAPGLNWGVWTLASAGGILLCARVGGAPTRAALLVPLALAAGFGVAAAVTAAPLFHAVIAGGVAALLAIAVLLAGNPGWEALTAPFMLALPVVAPVLVAGEAIRRAFELVGLVATPRHRPLLRGVLLALPVVGLFALMLANADPVLATLRDDLADAMARLVFVPRLLFFGALFTAALGGCGVVLHRGASPARPWRSRSRHLASRTPSASSSSVRSAHCSARSSSCSSAISSATPRSSRDRVSPSRSTLDVASPS